MKDLFQVKESITHSFIYSILNIHLSWNNQDTYVNLKGIQSNFKDALKEG